MKTKLTLRTLLAAVGLLVGTSAWGESLIFNEDFADGTYNVAWGGTSAGGVAPAVADGSLKVANGSASGDRSAYIAFGSKAYTGNCRLTFDMAMTKSNWSGKNNYLYVLPTATTDRYPSTINAALSITQDYTGAITIAGESVGTNDGTILTYDLYLNTETGYAKVIVKNGATAIKTISYATTATGINTLNLQFNKNNGAFSIDNIFFYSITPPAFTLSEDSKIIAVAGSETVSVTGITGSVSVKSNNSSVATATYDAGTITINGVADGITKIVVTGTNDGLTLEKEIEVTVGSVATTDVTVNYLCGGSPIAAALVLNDVAVGSTLTAGDITYSDVVAGTGCRYVNPAFSPALPYVVEEDGVININYTRQDAVAALAVKAKIGSSTYDIKSIDLDSKYVGDDVAFNYPRYFLVGTTLYETSQNAHGDGYYKWNYTLEGSTVNIEYNTTVSTNIVYYAEGESITGMEVGSSSNSDIRCSDGKAGYFTTANVPITLKNLEAGCYRIFSHAWGGAGTTYTFKAGGNTVSTIGTTGSLNQSSSLFVLNAAADLTLEGSATTSSQVFDCVYVEKYDTDNNLVYNGDFSNTTWSAGWGGTGTDKKKAFVSNTNDLFTGRFAEMWAGSNTKFSNDADLYQTIGNVPAGTYILSANIVNSAVEGTGVLYAKVGDAADVTTDATNLSEVTAKSVTFTVSTPSTVRIGFKTTGISESTGWLAVDDFTMAEVVPASVTATIGDYGYTTFASPYALDLASMTASTGDVTAYYATAIGASSVTLTSIAADVQAGEGLILKGTAGATITIPVAATAGKDISNYLVGCTTETVLTVDASKYVLVNNTTYSKAEFQSLADRGATVPAGKAYLNAAAAGARQLSIVFADTEVTGVGATLVNSGIVNNEIFNLCGQRVAAPRKGLYIVNGKKIVKK